MDLWDTLVQSFNDALSDLVAAVPTILGALIILLIGWIVGRLVGGVVTRLLATANADHLFARYAGSIYGEEPGATKPSQYLGILARWLIYLVFFLAAANFLGWSQVSILLNEFLAWLPNLIVAVIIVLAAPVLGRILRTAIEASGEGMGLSNTALLGRVAEFAVVAFGVIVALYQVGIASDLVNILFIGVVGAMALAFGLAFGFGARDVAAEMSRSWYARSAEVATKIQEATAEDSSSAPTTSAPPPSGGAPAQGGGTGA
jgi:hypothetical protein